MECTNHYRNDTNNSEIIFKSEFSSVYFVGISYTFYYQGDNKVELEASGVSGNSELSAYKKALSNLDLKVSRLDQNAYTELMCITLPHALLLTTKYLEGSSRKGDLFAEYLSRLGFYRID